MPTVRCTSCGFIGNAPALAPGLALRCPQCRQKIGITQAHAPAPVQPAAPTPSGSPNFAFADDSPQIVSTSGAGTKSSSFLVDFLTFRRMITPIFIQVIFWLGTLAAVGLGIYLIIDGLTTSRSTAKQDLSLPDDLGPFAPAQRPKLEANARDRPAVVNTGEVIFGVLLAIIGPVVVRIYCEMLIIFFVMNESLTDIKNRRFS